MIWIDVHPARENPTNMTRTLLTPVHVGPSYASCGQFPYVATFHETLTYLDRSHCSWEEGLPTQSTARQLTDLWVHTLLLSQASQWSRRRKPSSWRWPTTRFAGPISPACDWYVQYVLMGQTHRSLTDVGGGYNLRGVGLPHTHSPTFPTSCLPFPLVAPPVSIFTRFH
jgi:hypothetical protein